jgi:hypothetical protein
MKKPRNDDTGVSSEPWRAGPRGQGAVRVIGVTPAPADLYAELVENGRVRWLRCCCLLVVEEAQETGAVDRRLDAFVATHSKLVAGQGGPVSEWEGFQGFVFDPMPSQHALWQPL